MLNIDVEPVNANWLNAPNVRMRLLGGPGSGNFNHAGRPGEVGGSAPAVSGAVKAVREGGGFTYNAVTGSVPTTGFVVSPYKDRERKISKNEVTVDTLAQFTIDNWDLLKQNGNYLGGWYNPNDDKVYLDVSTIVDSANSANDLAWATKQLEFYDLEKGVSVAVTPPKLKAATRRVVKEGFYGQSGIAYNRAGSWSSNARRFNRAFEETSRKRTNSGRVESSQSVACPEGLNWFRAAKDSPRKTFGPLRMTFDAESDRAIKWAQKHTAELIDDLSKTTKKEIRDAIVRAFSQGTIRSAYQDILDAVGDEARANVIARTESMRAANGGQREAWLQAVDSGLLSGRARRTWIATPDEGVCPLCEALDGQTADLDGEYPDDGGDGPPLHPNCRCTEGVAF